MKHLRKENLFLSWLSLRKIARSMSGRKLNFLGEFACNISFFLGGGLSSDACVKKHNKFIWNRWYCIIGTW